jgi:hypothetical protein
LDFGALLLDIESRTRSPEVILYRLDDFGDWSERPNLEHGYWKPSRRPTALRESRTRVFFIACLFLVFLAFIVRAVLLLKH